MACCSISSLWPWWRTGWGGRNVRIFITLWIPILAVSATTTGQNHWTIVPTYLLYITAAVPWLWGLDQWTMNCMNKNKCWLEGGHTRYLTTESRFTFKKLSLVPVFSPTRYSGWAWYLRYSLAINWWAERQRSLIADILQRKWIPYLPNHLVCMMVPYRNYGTLPVHTYLSIGF